MKYIPTFESFVNESLNEMTRIDNVKINSLLKKLKKLVKSDNTYNDIEDFVRMDTLDVYTDYTGLIDHLRARFPQVFQKDKEVQAALESWVAESTVNEKDLKSVTNKDGVTFNIGDTAKTPDKHEPEIKITGFMKGKDGHMKAIYNAGMYADVFNLDDLELKESNQII